MENISFSGSKFRNSLTPQTRSKAMLQVAEAHHVTGELLVTLKKTMGSSDYCQAVQSWFNSPEARLTSAIRANAKIAWSKRSTLEHCFSLPATLDFTNPFGEIVQATARPKTSPGVRVTCEFGLQHRTGQDLVERVMALHFKPRPFQYTTRGVAKAIASCKAYVKTGHVYVARLDISNHFGSFDPSELPQKLPLPQEVVDHVVLGRFMAVEQAKNGGGYTHLPLSLPLSTLLLLARQGLPQGSGCSPIIAAYVLAQLGWNTSALVVLVNYADDFILLSQCEKGTHPAKTAVAVGEDQAAD